MNKNTLLLITVLTAPFVLAFLGIVWLEYLGSNAPRIEGRYITTEDKSLRSIRLKLKLYKDDLLVSEYETGLGEDGTFSIKVKETGQYYVNIFLSSCDWPTWFDPVLSNGNFFILYDLKKGEVTNIGEHYILDAIQVISPANNEKVVRLEELVFEWKEVPTADYYTLKISRVKSRKNDSYELLIRALLLETKISYEELQSLPIAKDVSDFTNQMPFNTVFNILKPGEYRIDVYANKFSTDKTFRTVIQDNDDCEIYFYIK
jgi:hypothetical protein